MGLQSLLRGIALLGALSLSAPSAWAQVDWSQLKLEFVTPSGVVAPTDPIEVWLRYSNLDPTESLVVDSSLPLGGLNPANVPTTAQWLNPATELYENVPFASYTSFDLTVGFGCSGTFTTNCTQGPPYTFDFAADPFTEPFTLGPGQSTSFLFGTFTPSHGPVAAGTYEFYRAVTWLNVNGLGPDGQALYAVVFPSSTCPFDNATACTDAGHTFFTRVVEVPEPGSVALFGLGMAGLAWRLRRRA